MSTKVNWYSAFLHLVLIGFAVQNLLLVRENRTLRQEQAALIPARLEIGELFESLAIVDLDGRASQLDFAAAGRDNVLLVFTTQCPYCLKNQPAWRELHGRFNDRYRVLGIGVGDVASVKSYTETHDLSYPVVVPADIQNFALKYKIPSVPTTVVVGTDGKVKKVWSGLLTEDSYEVLEAG